MKEPEKVTWLFLLTPDYNSLQELFIFDYKSLLFCHNKVK